MVPTMLWPASSSRKLVVAACFPRAPYTLLWPSHGKTSGRLAKLGDADACEFSVLPELLSRKSFLSHFSPTFLVQLPSSGSTSFSLARRCLRERQRLRESCSIPGREYDTNVSSERLTEEHGNAFCPRLPVAVSFCPLPLCRSPLPLRRRVLFPLFLPPRLLPLPLWRRSCLFASFFVVFRMRVAWLLTRETRRNREQKALGGLV